MHDRTTLATSAPTHARRDRHTAEGVRIRCGHVVMAAGYANQHWLKPSVARNRSSYAFITDPIDADLLGPLAQTMVWESARPYLYMRTHRRPAGC